MSEASDLERTEPASERRLEQAREEGQLAREGYAPFDLEAYRNGDLTPVYFGSAVNNFGIQLLLEGFLRHSPPPKLTRAGEEILQPGRGGVWSFR